MRVFYKAPRLHVEAPLNEGAEIALTKPQAHHLINVLRLKTGAQILLFNGRDGEWLAQLINVDKRGARAQCESQIRPQPPAPQLIYCFAPLKSARLDYMVQKAVEMGAGVLQPVITQFTHNTQLNPAKIQASVIEAAQQCGLLTLPTISPTLKLTKLLETWQHERHLVFCDEILAEGENDALLTLTQLGKAPVGVLIGPEGGFSDAERQALRSQPFVTAISLGSRILRADTAAVAALALINAVFEY